jgi:hypothetical protein
MTKTYEIHGSFEDWMKTNRYVIFEDILESCEAALNEGLTNVLVANVLSPAGSMLFTLPDTKAVIESLSKCERAFVGQEDYERAARARDCSLVWLERDKIYKENRTP